MQEGYFDTVMPRRVLEYYLSHAVTAGGICDSDTLDDDIRVILKAGIKFLGRATGIWKAGLPDDEHFARAKASACRIHEADPEIILQACIFEYIYREDLDGIPVPAFVFEEFGKPVENRCFSFDNMIFDGNSADEGIPDISKEETQMWFFYRAANYIDAGCEAFHMGQIHLYTANDRGLTAIKSVIDRMRAYGKIHARRHKIILDAHSHSIVLNGHSLLDYNAMPYTRYPFPELPGEKLVLVREGKTGGGINPDGVYQKTLPFLMEYDNWCGKDQNAFDTLTYEERAWAQWWGYDQITWFMNQPCGERDKFLEYTFKWTCVNNPDAFFAFPFARSGYKINNRSEACKDGCSQEDTLCRLMTEGYEKYRKYANPADILDYGARDTDDPATGVRLPEKVVVYGSFQHYVGAVNNDSNSEITRMYYIGDNKYALAFVMPYAGEYDFGISTWGTLSACVSTAGGKMPYSGSGGKGKLTVGADNTIVRIVFDYMQNTIEVTQTV